MKSIAYYRGKLAQAVHVGKDMSRLSADVSQTQRAATQVTHNQNQLHNAEAAAARRKEK